MAEEETQTAEEMAANLASYKEQLAQVRPAARPSCSSRSINPNE